MQDSKKTSSRNLKYEKANDVHLFFAKSISSKEAGFPSIGWLCTYTPEELIIASGFTPIRIMGSKNIYKSESYFPINYCPYIKAVWEYILTNNKKLRSIIFTNSCDGMRRLYDVCRKYSPEIPSYMLDVPRINTKDSLDYYACNLKKLINFLEKIKGEKINSSSIEKAAEFVNSKRKLLKEFTSIYMRLPDLINASTYYSIMELSMTSKPNTFVEDLNKYINSIKEIAIQKKFLKSVKPNNTPKIMIIGNFINEEKLWDMLSLLDLRLAADDSCTSSRYFEGFVEMNHNSAPNSNLFILKAIASRYINKPKCARMSDLGAKLDEIENNISSNSIDGVIFISLKFCDNTLYFFPLLKQKLAKLKVPTLFLELEYNNFSGGQIKTRIQAFLEML